VAAYIKAGNYVKFMRSDIIKESYLAMRECWKICVKQGIDPRKVTPTRYYYLPFFLLIPFTKWIYQQKGMQEMFEGHVQHSPAEMQDMYFTLLAQGKKYGIDMPVYENYQNHVLDYLKKIPGMEVV
jgi:2-dehydropantoate 2-reductase